jgi:hypothetical protein
VKDETSPLETHSGQQYALLEGGPAEIPVDRREHPVGVADGKIKLAYYGGYEHFERTDEYSGGHDGQRRPIYRWVSRTEIAE